MSPQNHGGIPIAFETALTSRSDSKLRENSGTQRELDAAATTSRGARPPRAGKPWLMKLHGSSVAV
jgi:hypothetical protein